MSDRVTAKDEREDTCRPDTNVPLDVFLAAKDAAYGAMSYLDMDWTAHRPVQGDATPKVIAYWVAAAVIKAMSDRPGSTTKEDHQAKENSNATDNPKAAESGTH